MSKDFINQIQAQLEEDAQKSFEERKALWDKSSPKRELASHLLQKLTQDDPVAKRLEDEAQKTTLDLSRTPLDLPSHKNATIQIHPFAPTGVTLSSLLFGSWPSSPKIEVTGSVPGNNMSWSLTTATGIHAESITTMLYSSLRPRPGSRRMTVLASPDIVFSYGNHAFLRHSHTHAWIGLQVVEWDFSTNPLGNRVQINVNQQNNIFDMTTDHDFRNHGKPALQALDIPIVDNHSYVIGVQCGGDVESHALSYANLKVSVDAIYVNFS
jgi:hypothetical protein